MKRHNNYFISMINCVDKQHIFKQNRESILFEKLLLLCFKKTSSNFASYVICPLIKGRFVRNFKKNY